MAETIYTQTLAKAAEFHGSTQSLANFLHVPEATLLRWMSGRAQMPLQAFLKLVEAIVQHERTGGGLATAEDSAGKPRTFKIGELLARCAGCDSTEFVAASSESPTRLTAGLACRACGEQVIHGDLISRLAREAVQRSRALAPTRQKRRAVYQAPAPRKTPQGEDQSA